MKIPFIKMQALGNDFVIILEDIAINMEVIKKICNRHYGIGCDQLIMATQAQDVDLEVKIYNADGSRAEACGNAMRCLSRYMAGPYTTMRVDGRIIKAELLDNGNIRVAMGEPLFEWHQIPLNTELDTLYLPFHTSSFDIGACVNIGNPHIVFFHNNISDLDIQSLGPIFENHEYFPQKINVNFAEIIDRKNIKLRTWERGTGETLACASGACAAYAVSFRLGFIQDTIDIEFTGGKLRVNNFEGVINIEGDADYIFKGEIAV